MLLKAYFRKEKNKIINIYIYIYFYNRNLNIDGEIDPTSGVKKELNYNQYIDRMHLLSQNKRDELIRRRKDYCNYIPEKLGLNNSTSPVKKKNKRVLINKK